MKKLTCSRLIYLLTLTALFLLPACQTRPEFTELEQPTQTVQEEQVKPIIELLSPIDDTTVEQAEEPEIFEETGNNSIAYLENHELAYRGLILGETTVQEFLYALGEPLDMNRREITEFPYEGLVFFDYIYDGARYIFDDENPQVLFRMSFSEYTDYPTPRGINIGDTLEDIVSKFPNERNKLNQNRNIWDYLEVGEDVIPPLYGAWSEETGYGYYDIRNGFIQSISLITSTGLELFIRFEDHIVTYFSIGYFMP